MSRPESAAAGRPLYVDMDGSLLATDSLWESVLALVKSKPFVPFLFPLWLLKGKAGFKHEVARRVVLDVSLLPYRKDVLAFLDGEKKMGRQIILATAADRSIAVNVAARLQVFSDVLATDGSVNLSGCMKLDAIERHSGGREFDYIGNSTADIPVWRAARTALMVSPSPRLLKRVSATSSVGKVFAAEGTKSARLVKALRIHQWVKNLLVFVPLIVGHKITNVDMAFKAMWGFLAFSFCASSVYLLNDLMDLEADRHHPQKRNRPFAAGTLGIRIGIVAIPLLLILGGTAAVLLVTPRFSLELLIYFAITLGYSFWMKRVVILDVLTLAGLYTIRVLAGGAATGIKISPWLLAFSAFLFLSLALMKRYSELRMIQTLSGVEVKGRDYNVGDIELLGSVGPSSGLLCILVLAFYVNSPDVALLYRSPLALWLIGPCLLYWITRLWLLAHRGAVVGDPIVFTARDPVSYIVGALILVVIAGASLF